MSFNEKIEHMFDWGWDKLDAPLFSSLFVMLIVLILAIIIGIAATVGYKKKTYLERPKGILFLAELYYNMCANFVRDKMGGKKWESFTGYFMCLFAYLFLAFQVSLLGLPSVIDWLWGPLSCAIIMFVMIQATAIKYQHLHYFHRYVEPFAFFLPINLVTMWSPIISTTMRLFGNCLSGSVIIGLIQWALTGLSSSVAFWASPNLAGSIAAPFVMGTLNIYFSLFSGFIQTLVFGTLSALWIAAEGPGEDEVSPEIQPSEEILAQ